MKNQCAGCQADWPVKVNKFGGHIIHEVVGGYPHEVMSCTADRYGHYRCAQCLTFMWIMEHSGTQTLYECYQCDNFMWMADPEGVEPSR